MRARSGRGERKLEQALGALRRALDACAAPWMVIGGIAIIAHGVRRLTTDIDAVVQGDAVTIQAVLEELGRHRITPRIKKARAFAEENLVLLLRHRSSGVDLDVSFGWTAFEVEALKSRASARYGRESAPMATPEDLVILKAMAGRPKDVDDATALLALYPRIDVARVRATLAELAEIADAPEVLQGLRSIIAHTRAATPRARRRTRVRPQRRR